jgi:hypothetical protein
MTSEKRQRYRNRKQIICCQGLEMGEQVQYKGDDYTTMCLAKHTH